MTQLAPDLFNTSSSSGKTSLFSLWLHSHCLTIQRESWRRAPKGDSIVKKNKVAPKQRVQAHLCSETEEFHQHSTTWKKHIFPDTMKMMLLKKKLSAVTKSKIESHKEGPPIPTHACYVYTLCLCCVKWITWIIFCCMFDKCYSHSILTPTYTTRSSFPLIHNPNFFQDIVFFSAH